MELNEGDDSYNIENYTVKELIIILKSFFNLDFELMRNPNDLMKILNDSINNYKIKYNKNINSTYSRLNSDKNILFFNEAITKINDYIQVRPYSLKYLLNSNEDEYNYLKLEDDKEVETDDFDNDNDNDRNEDDLINQSNAINNHLNTETYNTMDMNMDMNIDEYDLPLNVAELDKITLSKLYKTFNMSYNTLSIEELEDSFTELKNKILDMEDDSKQIHLLKYINKAYKLLRKHILNELYEINLQILILIFLIMI
jgi:hypothetical protein